MFGFSKVWVWAFSFFWFSSDSDSFQRMVRFFFGSVLLVFIGLARQQYKDAKPFTLAIAYSTEEVKPSIFGNKSPISEFLKSGTKCKPLWYKA